jgi:hypothetical protein
MLIKHFLTDADFQPPYEVVTVLSFNDKVDHYHATLTYVCLFITL